MERFLIALALLIVAVVVARLLRSRRKPAVAPSRDWHLPTHIDPADLATGTPWVVAIFTSSTCETCQSVLTTAAPLASDDVAVLDLPYQSQRDLHDRYGIEAVPSTLVVAPDGNVVVAWIGVIEPGVLWAAVAELTAGPADDTGEPT